MRYCPVILIALFLLGARECRAQQTVFNVPSADVLDRGVMYGEFDFGARTTEVSFTFAPRFVTGIGHNIETGVNLLGLNEPATGQYTLSPAIKWKFYDGGKNGWSAFVGNNAYIPVRKRTYDVGTYSYIETAKRFSTGTRIGAGAYYFSRNVVADAQRAGGQFSLEQKLSSNLTLAADWFTGNHSNGFFTPGLIWSATKKFTIYAAYELGNGGITDGNHGPLIEFGYTF